MTEHGVQTVKIMITIADLLNTIIYFHNTANNVWAPYTCWWYSSHCTCIVLAILLMVTILMLLLQFCDCVVVQLPLKASLCFITCNFPLKTAPPQHGEEVSTVKMLKYINVTRFWKMGLMAAKRKIELW